MELCRHALYLLKSGSYSGTIPKERHMEKAKSIQLTNEIKCRIARDIKIAKLKAAQDKKGRRYGDYGLEEFQPSTVTRLLIHIDCSRSHARKALAAAWKWGRTAIDDMPPNPMKEIETEPRRSRVDVYVTDEEYEAMYAFVDSYWKAMMEFAYICRARRSELQNMTRDQLLESGVQLKRGKGSWGEITTWTPRLQQALKTLDEYNSGMEFDYVFGTQNTYKGKGVRPMAGVRVGKSTLDTQWQNLKKKQRKPE